VRDPCFYSGDSDSDDDEGADEVQHSDTVMPDQQVLMS
jgi:hypothetical protein